jgi:hypothetical protein
VLDWQADVNASTPAGADKRAEEDASGDSATRVALATHILALVTLAAETAWGTRTRIRRIRAVVVIAEYLRGEPLEHFVGPRCVADEVAEGVPGVDVSGTDVGEDGLERREI